MTNIFMKICSKCKINKFLNEFHHSNNKIQVYCKKCRKEYDRKRYITNKEKLLSANKNWRIKNKCWQNIYNKNKRKSDIGFRLSQNLRNRLNRAIEINQKAGSAIHGLGCSIGQFKLYLENYFPLYPGMNWSGYGLEWELDHFIPLSFFDLSNQNELLEASHYTNIQPLWKRENRKKSNFIA